MTCGIYILRFKGTDKVYIGQSVSIENRYKKHLSLLASGLSSRKLNHAYTSYGAPSLEILIECSEAELNTFENEAIEIFNSVSEGFNSLELAEQCPTLEGPEHGRAIYTKEQVLLVLHLLIEGVETIRNISQSTGVSVEAISHIKNKKTHTWLGREYPAQYSKLDNLPSRRCSAKDRGIIYPPIVSPNGDIFEVSNTTKFAAEHNLSQSNLSAVLRGVRKSCKGWKLYKE